MEFHLIWAIKIHIGNSNKIYTMKTILKILIRRKASLQQNNIQNFLIIQKKLYMRMILMALIKENMIQLQVSAATMETKI